MAAVTEDGLTEPGTVAWNYSVASSAAQYLAVGETATESFTVSISDGHGGTIDQLVTVTIIGSNDDPTISVTASTGFIEAADASAQNLTDSGTISFNDVDSTDIIDISYASNGAAPPCAGLTFATLPSLPLRNKVRSKVLAVAPMATLPGAAALSTPVWPPNSPADSM